MAKGVDRFREATVGLGLNIQDQNQSTHTAQEAADAVGAPVGAIVKSLVFLVEGQPLLVLVSGPNMVNLDALSQRLGASLSKADANTVKTATGFSIGGVPPFGHPQPLRCVMGGSGERKRCVSHHPRTASGTQRCPGYVRGLKGAKTAP
jgi:prolyl-tRNA editing enzyme YbaK/EbsC (Cys-tRNA(Pro) deacylase)